LHHLALSADDVLKKLMNLDTSNAAGIDNLHPTIIKSCAGPVLATITSLYSSCLMYHTMPMQWKIHKICPVYKSGDRSNCLEVTSGVPQGSVLGPLLFLVYVNDMPDRILSTIYLFADDIKFLRVLSLFTDRYLLPSHLYSLTN
uniref:Reverse transcriptase domain-containing protein n=1 Tax=Amphimedon queenslandica TaxID=400682 RepID=A0A1X7UAS6_AMPQE